MRDRRLQSIETVVEWQQRVPTKGNDDGLVLNRENGRPRLSRPGRQIGDARSFQTPPDRANPKGRLVQNFPRSSYGDIGHRMPAG
jgi:hypothetical protein